MSLSCRIYKKTDAQEGFAAGVVCVISTLAQEQTHHRRVAGSESWSITYQLAVYILIANTSLL